MGQVPTLSLYFYLWDVKNMSASPTLVNPVNIYLAFTMGHMGFPDGAVVKNLSASASTARDMGLIPGLGRSPGVGYGSPF